MTDFSGPGLLTVTVPVLGIPVPVPVNASFDLDDGWSGFASLLSGTPVITPNIAVGDVFPLGTLDQTVGVTIASADGGTGVTAVARAVNASAGSSTGVIVVELEGDGTPPF